MHAKKFKKFKKKHSKKFNVFRLREIRTKMIVINKILTLFIILFIVPFVICESVHLKFPKNFLIGTASSNYQVEGAWNVCDKGESNWDHHVHFHPEKVRNGSTGDISTDAYHKYEEDARLLQKLGVDYYRFSISWSRILPHGHSGYVSKCGLKHYHNLLDSLEKRNITPIVTIYHVDYPQILETKGAWLNESMAYLFADYARIIYKEFAHRVKYFIPINEPGLVCKFAYRNGIFPPYYKMEGIGEYICQQNMLKAHALAYRIYDKEFRPKYNGKVGVNAQCNTAYNKYKNDTKASDIAFEFECGWQLHPVLSKTGGYPEIMKQQVAERSKAQGLSTSRLPTLSQSWNDLIRGSADFLGLNHYTSSLVESLPKSSMKDWPNDEGLVQSTDPKWPLTQDEHLILNPKGLRDILVKIKNKYGNPPVYITENGMAIGNGVHDKARIKYLYLFMKAMLTAMKKDLCNVKSYTVWSFLDSFEWNNGYSLQFGLVHVDFNSKNRQRTLKKSAFWLKNITSTRELLPHYTDYY